MWTLRLKTVCPVCASKPADTRREPWGLLRGMAARVASAVGAHMASGEQRQGAVMICGSQGLHLGGLHLLLPGCGNRWPPRSVCGGGEKRQPGPARGVAGWCDAPWSSAQGSAESRWRPSVGRIAGKVTAPSSQSREQSGG